MAQELLGFTPDELVGCRITDRLDPRDRAELTAKLEAVRFHGGRVEPTDVLIENQSGEMRLFRTTASPLFNEFREPQEMIVSMRDITDSKRIEQQLIQSERLAAMGQMIAGVAHELNNPLTAVLGVTEMLRDSARDETERRHLDLAHGQARRAAQIVQSLLSFARPPHPHKTRLHVGDVIERCLQFHEKSLHESRINVDFVARPDAAAVLGDPSQLTQVFLNLITNAEQAIREIRDHGTIRVRLATFGERVVVTFQDDGVGIRRDILPRIFDPFFTTKRPGRGTGLGLSICLAILREHNGDIEAQPISDGGAVFTVSLPVAKGTELFMTEPGASRPQTVKSGSLAGFSVLVVDDEEGIRQMIGDGLAARGVRVELASSGEEALCLMESRPFDAVLCDVNLKNALPSAISGEEFYLRAQRMMASGLLNHKPVFAFMTGDVAENGPFEHAGPGIRTLQKPFRISELAEVLTQILVTPVADSQSLKSS
jgi:two-component system NtrC family sensor kinase